MAEHCAAEPFPVGTTDLYVPEFEHDACGVAMVADLKGRRDHGIVRRALTALLRLEHRGARGSEVNTGDGAGILLQIPDAFYRAVVPFDLPAEGAYAAGLAFLPTDRADEVAAEIDALAAEEGLRVLGWRELPTDADSADLGPTARSVMPTIRQLFVAGDAGEAGIDLERRTFCLRKRAEHATGVYFPSLSPRTIVYKGMLSEPQVEAFYPDLSDERVVSALALVHSRFSTNTFPAWPLAHPYRYVAHNGEINTLRGNRNWMAAREALLRSDLIPGDLARLSPIVTPDASDSATFDEVLELLHLSGRSLPHAVLMMIPEAWENHAEMDPARRAFYEFHSTLMEPWDGPALIAFTDGTVAGAVLDRNGLRPARYWVTEDGLVVLASEVGVLDVEPSEVVRKGRLEPGRMFLVDTAAGKLVDDAEIKGALAAEHPYEEWLHAGLIHLGDLADREREVPTHAALTLRQQSHGYTEEELNILLKPMAATGAEPIGSMGNDAPLAAISARPRQLFDYFNQLFAQVTNPPLDAIREELVTSLGSQLGPEQNLLDASAAHCRTIMLPEPVLTNDDLARIVHINDDGDYPGFTSVTVRGTFRAVEGGAGLARRLEQICTQVSEAIEDGARLIVLSQRGVTKDFAPIPSLLLTGAVHQHLVRETHAHPRRAGRRGRRRARGAPHRAAHRLRRGRGEPLPRDGHRRGPRRCAATSQVSTARPRRRTWSKALAKGVRKTMSKIGVSTVASYTRRADLRGRRPGRRGDRHLLHRHHVAAGRRRLRRARRGGAHPAPQGVPRRRDARVAPRARRWAASTSGGARASCTCSTRPPCSSCSTPPRQGRYEIFKEYTRAVDEQAHRLMTLRGLFRFKDGTRAPIDVDEVEPVEEIVKRFATGAISYGSISKEMHETLAIAMNRLGGKSNTGEGGEDADRYTVDANGDNRRSAIKQVASGRFGVTSEYLVNADDLQIKISQGAKPGEGGQLPGAKVYPWIAKTRYSTPGVGLISPPPHHDIYSIEDIKQLIHDLKNANPRRAGPRQARQPGRRRHGRGGRGEGVLRRRAHLGPRRRHGRLPAVARSSTRAGRGSWAWPRPSRPCCATACATASSCRPTGSSRPGATW